MEAPKVDKIYLEIDGLYYPQVVFDAMLNQVMEAILQRILDVKKTPRAVGVAVMRLRSPRVRNVVYRRAMDRTKQSVPGLKAEELDDSYTLIPLEKPSQKPLTSRP